MVYLPFLMYALICQLINLYCFVRPGLTFFLIKINICGVQNILLTFFVLWDKKKKRRFN